MTTTADVYINTVLEQMPRDTPLREQIATELRGHVAERLEAGLELEEILHQLGDPKKLAESYLSAVPLVAVPAGDRIVAKAVDLFLSVALLSPLIYLCTRLLPGVPLLTLVCVMALLGGFVVMAIYTAIAESSADQTIGKRWMGMRVVGEAGTRISFGQALVRQLPIVFQVIWVDALFALFTERHQRAFELLSHTRVVRVPGPEGQLGHA